MTAPAGHSPCRDCETGACPCGATCEGCDFTGNCSTCRGTGFVEGSGEPRGLRPGGWNAGLRYGEKLPMEPCEGCTRAHRCDSAYYRMSPQQVLNLVTASPSLRDRPRCTVCHVPFGSMKSRWFQAAVARGCATVGTFRKIA